jgi:hypothetical protein
MTCGYNCRLGWRSGFGILLGRSNRSCKRFVIKPHDWAFVTVLWEYDKEPPGAKLCWICLSIPNYSNFRCFAQSGFRPAVPASFMNAALPVITRCFTCSQWNRFWESCLSYQLVKQERFHTACGSTRRILWAQQSMQERGQVTEAGGGISTRGPWAGRANAARYEQV